ncbi:MAG: hypothetical protein CVV23_11120 [Ignavibacteriae bacterium HGW-Ignavibacteriae-2]|nr:MAG: hypothetical protein CVV23_11120 [Ignavibacteriae bacterium HGW-Ignavibacteriae-2]
MKKKILLLILFAVSYNLNAQWEKVYSNSTWANGASLYTHKNVLFQTGYGNNTNQTLRSGDNGTTWTDISSSFPYTVYFILSYGNTVFAVTTTLGTTQYSFYASTDEGLTWAEKSNIVRGSGNGAILSMASDGNNLFCVSNRRSIYKSVDGGSTWTEIIINYSGTSGILSFAVSGNTYFAVLEGVGCVVSTDAGLNWTLKNGTSSIGVIYKLNNDVWGTAGFSGIYKFNLSTNSWENNYTPGSFNLPISIGANGNNLISTFGDFLTGNRKYYSSYNNGESWTELTTDVIGLSNSILSNYAVTANSSYFFAEYWKSTGGVISYSIYRLPTATTTYMEDAKEFPNSFVLSQNYPNPFNPTTTIEYALGIPGMVKIIVYDILGREINTLIDEYKVAGNYQVKFNGSSLSSGIYYYSLVTDYNRQTKAMVLVE